MHRDYFGEPLHSPVAETLLETSAKVDVSAEVQDVSLGFNSDYEYVEILRFSTQALRSLRTCMESKLRNPIGLFQFVGLAMRLLCPGVLRACTCYYRKTLDCQPAPAAQSMNLLDHDQT